MFFIPFQTFIIKGLFLLERCVFSALSGVFMDEILKEGEAMIDSINVKLFYKRWHNDSNLQNKT